MNLLNEWMDPRHIHTQAFDNPSDEDTSWRITRRDWDFFKLYDRFYRISEETLRETSIA